MGVSEAKMVMNGRRHKKAMPCLLPDPSCMGYSLRLSSLVGNDDGSQVQELGAGVA